MKQLNRYYRCAKISERKTRQIIKYFALDLTANKTARLTALTHQSVNRIYLKIRRRIAEEAERASPFSSCEIEVDESYFGARRVRGKRGRGAGNKTIVFGIYKRNGSVFTEIVPNAAQKTLQNIIRGKVSLDSVIHSDGWRGYNGLVDVGYSKHLRVNHSDDVFAIGDIHINGIESFWSYAKRRLHKFNGVPKRTFYLHLKECEYRFNHRTENLQLLLLKLLERFPL
ncbi:MAG TPA: IS1595 family transposase [Pyrinomonadaceae bacterium]|jgi:transposase-like protein|nr:IS1595 family transposase [Pyrinomonadaceae bacterium]